MPMLKPKAIPIGSTCPKCQRVIDGSTSLENDITSYPQPFDYSVCCYCATMLLFQYDMTSIILSDKESDQLPPGNRRELMKVKNAINLIIRRKKNRRVN